MSCFTPEPRRLSPRPVALFVSLLALLLLIGGAAANAAARVSAQQTLSVEPLHFDFGGAETAPGFVPVTEASRYDDATGYGWAGVPQKVEVRDRNGPDALRRDYVFGHEVPAVFRVRVPAPGLYRVTLITGDTDFGDHVLQASVAGSGVTLPVLTPKKGEFLTLTATVRAEGGTLDFTFSSPIGNWVLNALTLEPVTAGEKPRVASAQFKHEFRSAWADVKSWPDPTERLYSRFNLGVSIFYPPSVGRFSPTGLTRADYLKLITGEVDFWRKHQDKNGAIIDPYLKIEWQYSTPAFAHAAALLVVEAHRKDLLEPAARALDWSARTLSQRKAATSHEDFFAPMLAHAIPLLKPLVKPDRAARWEADIRAFDPYSTYRAAPGTSNWNVVALSGEAGFYRLGLRSSLAFVEDSLAGQGRTFSSPYGLYLEGPMAYDHFPRLWAADLLAHGYTGKYAPELTEALRRGAITSLFLQSPTGELPAGGRSAAHQWNEAEQCVTFEIYAAQAAQKGDRWLAGTYKRAAHLSLASMLRWVRPSGEMQIVKNWMDPAQGFAFEGYSAHSQYNLLPMSMLAIAYENAAPTESVEEFTTPSEVGGFVVSLEPLHKIIANADGTYVEIDTNADPHYDATGLIRVHSRFADPQIGPSDSLAAGAAYRVPKTPRTTSAVGISWLGRDGKTWHRLGEVTGTKTTLTLYEEDPERVSFAVRYESPALDGPDAIVENYVLTPGGSVELTTETPGYVGPLRYTFPVLADNGKTKTKITLRSGAVFVTLNDSTQTFTPVGASVVRVDPTLYPNHNGYARLGIAEYPNGGGKATLRIAPK